MLKIKMRKDYVGEEREGEGLIERRGKGCQGLLEIGWISVGCVLPGCVSLRGTEVFFGTYDITPLSAKI